MSTKTDFNRDRVQPYVGNPLYWQYRGRPVLLLGGSVEDNLFQVSNIEEHLDLLASVGGNYVRCTMSSRDVGNVWAHERDSDTGLYDLNRPGEEYWRRFERFLELCEEREIIAQIELWDRFDFARTPWQDNPYNPRNNVNYTTEESGLPEAIDTHPGRRESCFFRSVPALEDNPVLLPYQHAQVDKLLSISLRHGNVLYCMDNETNESPEWPAYWAKYVRAAAEREGVGVELTEMWDAHDLHDPQHENTWGHPELYSFVDISQNSHRAPPDHWQNAQDMRRTILDSGRIRPLNTVKIYGANRGTFGNARDGQERFWRNLIGGLASSRFHRPPAGLGLSPRAQAHIRSARAFTDAFDLRACEPANELLSQRSYNEAYCTACPPEVYAVFFTDGGDVYLDVSAAVDRAMELWWLDILASRWLPLEKLPAGVGKARLTTPRDEGYWAALVKPGP